MKKVIATLPSGDTIFINTCVISSFLNQSAFSIFTRFSMVLQRCKTDRKTKAVHTYRYKMGKRKKIEMLPDSWILLIES